MNIVLLIISRVRIIFIHWHIFLGSFFAAGLILYFWMHLGYPWSYSEMIFLRKLKLASNSSSQQIDLVEIMPGNWETVCESNGYDESLYLTRYKKNFPTAGAMRSGSWGLIFIKNDGDFDLISSSCSRGTALEFKNNRCVPRKKAVLTREKKTQDKTCELFSMP